MLSPEDVRQQLATRFARQHRRWFADQARAHDTWPLTLVLGRPTEKDLIAEQPRVRRWVQAWESWRPPLSGVRIDWADRLWPRLGRQRVPECIVVDAAADVAALIGVGARWRRADARASRLAGRWPVIAGHAVLGRLFDPLADYAEQDFERLMALLDWADARRSSGLYLRQLPIAGLDTKWIAAHGGVVTELLRCLRGEAAETGQDRAADLHALLGLRRVPARMRVRLLCRALRQGVGGVEDLELPVDQLAKLPLVPRVVLIVENLETGLALPDWDAVVVVMKLGAAVKLVADVGWIGRAQVLYWGDIDTYGFEILNRARSVLPHLQSVLMDRKTLQAHQALCVEEVKQVAADRLPWLTADEAEVFQGLKSGQWGMRLRLEQERIPWAAAIDALTEAIGGALTA